MTFKEFYNSRFHPSQHSGLDRDIIEHLEYLEKLARECERVTEFGIGKGHSTAAFLGGCRGQVTSYDIERQDSVDLILSLESLPCIWTFIQHDTGDPDLVIDDTDFLFIDSKHTYDHLKKELDIHPKRVRKYIGFHDTVSHGETSNDGGNNLKGIMPAIREFLSEHPEWKIIYQVENNNGLMIWERQNA